MGDDLLIAIVLLAFFAVAAYGMRLDNASDIARIEAGCVEADN